MFDNSMFNKCIDRWIKTKLKDMYSKKEVVELFKDFEETNSGIRYIDECVDAFLEEYGLVEKKKEKSRASSVNKKYLEVIINGETYIKK